MAQAATTDHLVITLRDTIVSMVRRDGPDLSARQLGVFLTCYLQEGAHTVRGLAAELNVSKPAITRALDRLGELDLARRKVDPMDRRSILVQRTLKGAAYLRELRSIMAEASGTGRKAARRGRAWRPTRSRLIRPRNRSDRCDASRSSGPARSGSVSSREGMHPRCGWPPSSPASLLAATAGSAPPRSRPQIRPAASRTPPC